MKLLQHLNLILHRLIHQNQKVKREAVITLTVLAGMLVHWVTYQGNSILIYTTADVINSTVGYNEYTLYYTNLVTGFLRSFCMLLLCYYAIIMTDSKRLSYGLTTLITIAMLMDLFSMLSVEYYHAIKPFRYLVTYNFKDIYAAFEITCLVYSGTKFTLDFIKSTINYCTYRYNVLHAESCVPHSHKTNKTN